MPTAGIKGKSEKSGEKSGRSRNRRRSSRRSVDPLSTESLTGEVRKQGVSIFDGEEEHDPFDIDLSAATYSEDEDELAEAIEAPEEAAEATSDEE